MVKNFEPTYHKNSHADRSCVILEMRVFFSVEFFCLDSPVCNLYIFESFKGANPNIIKSHYRTTSWGLLRIAINESGSQSVSLNRVISLGNRFL